MSTKSGSLIDFDLLNAVTSTNAKPEVVFSGRAHHLEKCIWLHISAFSALTWTKFSSLVQHNMQITLKWSRSKPGVEFLYGKRLFVRNGSSYFGAVHRDMSTNLVWWQTLTKPIDTLQFTQARNQIGKDPSGVTWNYRGIALLYNITTALLLWCRQSQWPELWQCCWIFTKQ